MQRRQNPSGRRCRATTDIDFAIIELLFFAYRDFISDPDQILADYGFGRAHHRVLHFVNRNPGLTVADLLDMSEDHQAEPGAGPEAADRHRLHRAACRARSDRRQRELYPTAKGRALALALARPQSRRIVAHWTESGSAGRAAIERFLKAMVNPELRAQIDSLPASQPEDRHGTERADRPFGSAARRRSAPARGRRRHAHPQPA